MRSPVWEPPPRVRSVRVRPRWRWRRLTSVGVSESEGRSGESAARHRSSSTIRFPMPATRDWSRSRDLSGARDAPRVAASWAGVTVVASGPSADSSGSSTTPQPPGVVDHQGPAVLEPDRPPVPVRIPVLGCVLQLVHAGPAVDGEGAGHPEPEAHHRTGVHVQKEQLPDPAGGGEAVADQHAAEDRRGGRALQEPGVRTAHRGHGPVEGGLGQLAVGLDFEQLGHGPRVAIRSGPGSRWASLRCPCPPRSPTGPSSSPRW